MSSLYKVQDMVYKVLAESEEARNDDFVLVSLIYYMINPEVATSSFVDVMLAHKDLHLPPFESIRRTRQKLQAQYEELRPSKEIYEARINKQSDYINYAIDGYSSNFMEMVDNND